jgi:hypothetical protein
MLAWLRPNAERSSTSGSTRTLVLLCEARRITVRPVWLPIVLDG